MVTRVMRAVSGLGSIAAVAAFGLMSAADVLDADRSWLDALRHVAGGLLALIGIGVTTGAMGMWLMRLAGRGQAEFIVVLVGLVSLVAGAAATMGYSPLFAALVSGAVMVNLPHRELEKLKRVILEAEQPIAMALMLVAGMLADPVMGLPGLFVVMGLVLVRVFLKLALMRPSLRRSIDVNAQSPELAGLMRQNPLAIALAVAYTAAADDGGHVLMMVILIGLIAETWPFLHRLGHLVTPPSKGGTP